MNASDVRGAVYGMNPRCLMWETGKSCPDLARFAAILTVTDCDQATATAKANATSSRFEDLHRPVWNQATEGERVRITNRSLFISCSRILERAVKWLPTSTIWVDALQTRSLCNFSGRLRAPLPFRHLFFFWAPWPAYGFACQSLPRFLAQGHRPSLVERRKSRGLMTHSRDLSPPLRSIAC